MMTHRNDCGFLFWSNRAQNNKTMRASNETKEHRREQTFENETQLISWHLLTLLTLLSNV